MWVSARTPTSPARRGFVLPLAPPAAAADALKKFKFVCSLCVKVRLKVEKRKGKAAKGKTKGRKGSASSGAAAAAAPAAAGSGFHGNMEVVAGGGKPKQKQARTKAAGTSPGPAAAAAGMPPPPSSKPKLKRRRSSGDGRSGNNGSASGDSGGENGGAAGGGKPRKPKLKRPRSSGAGAGARARAGAEQQSKRSAMDVEGSDEDDSWGEESLDEDGRGEKGARASSYATRDRKGRVKYVEEASDNEGERLLPLLPASEVPGAWCGQSLTSYTSHARYAYTIVPSSLSAMYVYVCSPRFQPPPASGIVSETAETARVPAMLGAPSSLAVPRSHPPID